ncbi:MAG: DNA polymerase IV [Dehalococcoidia bacterium]
MHDPGPRLPRRVAHFDLDTFFVAVERARDPALVGVPVLVGHAGARGVVAAASYEARRFGCRSAQPMVQALRLCPQAVVRPPDFGAYLPVSRRFHELLGEVSPVVESVGIDEAYVDLTGVGDPARGAVEAAAMLRARVREELRIAVSVCIAGTRTTAKVGSDRAKPDGLIEVPVGGDAAFLAPLPIRDLPLVGPRLGEALAKAGVRTIGQAAALDERWLAQQFGRAGEVLAQRARGIDPSPVRAGGRVQRSISREVTFGVDVTDERELGRVLGQHAERVSADLREAGKRARTVTLKLRWDDFTTITRARTLERPVHGTAEVAAAGRALLAEVAASSGLRPVRLIGLGVTNLVEDALQLGFEDALAAQSGGGAVRQDSLDRALDGIRARFGAGSVTRGLSGRGARDGR